MFSDRSEKNKVDRRLRIFKGYVFWKYPYILEEKQEYLQNFFSLNSLLQTLKAYKSKRLGHFEKFAFFGFSANQIRAISCRYHWHIIWTMLSILFQKCGKMKKIKFFNFFF
jgi:hypothetical protein